jgi:DNA polymerase iota
VNKASLSGSFFCLSDKDPELGFHIDLTKPAGCVHGAALLEVDLEDPRYLRLFLGSHLAKYLRLKIEEDFGFTSTSGISTNKLLSKLVGTKNKPQNQTTLLALRDDDYVSFIDPHVIRKIPGIGFKTAHILEDTLLSRKTDVDSHTFESVVTAHEVRTHPGASPQFLEKLLGGPGAEKGIGDRVWDLLHGKDESEVKEANDIPTQISIEDTYQALDSLAKITAELHKLTISLIRRMHIDLLLDEDQFSEPYGQRWLAHPKTLRLSIRSRDPETQSYSFNRVSRSSTLPGFIFNLQDGREHLATRLVSEALIPLLMRMQPENGKKWNLQLINICVTNLVPAGREGRPGIGRDISVMFKRQDDVLRQWKTDTAIVSDDFNADNEDIDDSMGDDLLDEDTEASWDAETAGEECPKCGHFIPQFAVPAHSRFHELGG